MGMEGLVQGGIVHFLLMVHDALSVLAKLDRRLEVRRAFRGVLRAVELLDLGLGGVARLGDDTPLLGDLLVDHGLSLRHLLDHAQLLMRLGRDGPRGGGCRGRLEGVLLQLGLFHLAQGLGVVGHLLLHGLERPLAVPDGEIHRLRPLEELQGAARVLHLSLG
jgi:hypothetical protein